MPAPPISTNHRPLIDLRRVRSAQTMGLVLHFLNKPAAQGIPAEVDEVEERRAILPVEDPHAIRAILESLGLPAPVSPPAPP